MAKRINPRRIKIHHSYTMDEAARLLGVHKNTVRGWINDGLEVIDDQRPFLITGHCLKSYHESKREKRRVRCKPGTIYCLKCRTGRSPAEGMVNYQPTTKTTGDLIAICNQCGTMMYRRIRKADIGDVMPNLHVTVMEPKRSINETS
jgi:hypothetical protein